LITANVLIIKTRKGIITARKYYIGGNRQFNEILNKQQRLSFPPVIRVMTTTATNEAGTPTRNNNPPSSRGLVENGI